MAKKSLAEKLKSIDSISKDINKAAGKTIVGRLSNSEELKDKMKHRFIPTPSININTAIGGGWPIGNISIVCGAEDSGKTAILLETIAYQQKKDPAFVALWLESEASLKEATLNMFNVDKDRFILVEHERAGAGEEAINRIEAFLASGNIDMCVINSLKAIVPSEEFKKAMGDVQVGASARLNSKMMRKLTAIVQENEIAMVIVQHLAVKIGAGKYEDPLQMAGGQAIKYGAILTVDFRKHSVGKDDPITREEGIKIGVTVKKNHVVTDVYPYVKTEYYAIYGQGVEIYLEALELAVQQGILIKNGAFIKLPDENGEPRIINDEKMQWQGAAKFRQFCIDRPDFFEELKSALSGNVINLSPEEVNELKCEEYQSIDSEIASEIEINIETGDSFINIEEDVIEKATISKKVKPGRPKKIK